MPFPIIFVELLQQKIAQFGPGFDRLKQTGLVKYQKYESENRVSTAVKMEEEC